MLLSVSVSVSSTNERLKSAEGEMGREAYAENSLSLVLVTRQEAR